MDVEKIKNRVKQSFSDLKKRKALLGYFVAVTFLMVYQHSMGWAWDFNVYSLNAEYLFHNGVYMEWKRPPLLPAILGVLQFVFSMRLSEYVFIVLNSAFFLFSTFRLSNKFDLRPLYLYVFVMSPYIVFYSVLQGTELLFLSFVFLIVAELERPRAGLWLGLAFLTRYTAALYVVLFVLQRDVKKILKSGIIGFLTVLPWLIASYVLLGHPFASVADSYALDVVERGLVTPFHFEDIFLMTGFAIPFALYYLKELEFQIEDFMMLFISGLIIFRQVGTKMKVRRYLFDLSLPAGFFAAKGLNLVEKPDRIIYILMAISLLGSSFLVMSQSNLSNPGVYQQASDEVGECRTVSNKWPMLSYAGTPTGPLETHFNSTEDYIQSGYKVVEFGNGTYTVKGDRCVERSFDSTYLDRLGSVYGSRVCNYLPVYNCKVEEKIGGLVS